MIFPFFVSERFRVAAKLFRILVVAVTIAVFTYFFVNKSLNHFRKDSLTVKLINTLPFPLYFYIVQVNNSNASERLETLHLGNIRNNYYRIEYLDMKNSDEFWVVGYMGKKNLVYFSQHAVPNKNEDQILEIRNYIIQSQKLSERAQSMVEDLKLENVKAAIWFTLDLLLLFLNIALLLKKPK